MSGRGDQGWYRDAKGSRPGRLESQTCQRASMRLSNLSRRSPSFSSFLSFGEMSNGSFETTNPSPDAARFGADVTESGASEGGKRGW